MSKSKSVFETLNSINVNDKVDKKNNLTYLSWAWAWSEVKKACPDATYKMGETDYDEALGFMCHTSVCIEGETLEMWLPVMDGANKAMRKEEYSYTTRYGDKQVVAATMFDINKTMMRCLVKNLAMFGMGIYIYAGEDLPSTESGAVASKPVPKKPIKTTASTKPPVVETHINLEIGDDNWEKVMKYVIANKSKGLKVIGEQLSTKYKMSTVVKKEIAKSI